jgi:hypothetical protein
MLAVLSASSFTPLIGIHLSTSRLTSSYISTDGNPTPLASISSSKEYQEYMATAALKDQSRKNQSHKDSVLYNPTINTTADQPIFFNAIQAIRSATSAMLDPGATVNITTITIPDYLDGFARKAFQDAAEEILPGSFALHYLALPLTASARLAYQLNTCEGLRRESTCNIYLEESLVLFIDLNTHHLEVAIIDVDGDSGYIDDRLLSVGGTGSHTQENGSWTADAERVLRDFVSRNLDLKNNLQYLVAIVVSGEADKASMKELSVVLEKVLPEHKGLIRDTIAHEYVGAVGAAYWSKEQQDKPWRFRPFEDTFRDPHDEL